MTDRVLIDGTAMSIRASLPGFDVNTATLDQLAFVGGGNTLYPWQRGTALLPWTTSGGRMHGEVWVPYANGTAPVPPLCYAAYQASPTQLWSLYDNKTGGGDHHYFIAHITVSAVQFRMNLAGSVSGTVAIKYLLLLPK